MDSSPDSTRHTEKKSTLIEFPGVSRNSMPEWRKELSERVREVQEKRAREAAHEAAEAERQRLEAAIDPPQLELLPPAPPMPAMNPLVAAALKRIERAHQTAPSESRQPRTTLATAVAYAPEREDNDMSETVPSTPQLAFEEPEILQAEPEVTVEKAHHLSVVPVSEPVAPPIETPKAPPKRLIKDDDPVLNYLDSISGNLCVDDLNRRSASAFRRIVGAVLDLIFCGILTAPIAGAMYLTGSNLQDPRDYRSAGWKFSRGDVSLFDAHDRFHRTHMGHAPALTPRDRYQDRIDSHWWSVDRSIILLPHVTGDSRWNSLRAC